MSRFTHLHVHSQYSLLDGLPKIDELLDYVKELGMDAVALTDHGTLYGVVEFYKKAVKKGIKPIIGAEIYLAFERMHQRRPHIDDKRYHLVLLVKNETGYKNLVQLITKAHLEGFYYKPRVDEELLARHNKGLIALSACLQGKIPQLILAKKIKEAEQTALKYQEIFGKDNFYLEIQHHPNIKEQKLVNQEIVRIAKKYQIPLVATNDSHYLRPEDAEIQDILMLINTGADPNDPERLTMKEDDFSLRKPEEMIKAFQDVPETIKNTEKIKEMCQFAFELGKIRLPEFQTPENKDPHQYLKELCYQGIKNRYGKTTKEVVKRLEEELTVIKKTGFSSYFLIVQDFVNWAKKNKIVVGPGRGSAAGSIVSYLLKITSIDPLKYNLLFQRFLTEDRISPPDIDLDFADIRRDEVIEYLAQKYGRNHVAQIITFGTMAARAVVRDVGRVLGYSYSYCDRIAKMIPMTFSLDQTLEKVLEFKELYETDEKARRLIDIAKKLEGVVRHASTHACGVVISAEPLENIVPLQHSSQNDRTIVTQYDMYSIEDLGLLKVDLLGLNNLTIIERTLNLIEKNRNIKIDLSALPLDDKKTFSLLQKGETTSVFQLESSGMKRYLRELKPETFDDIVVILALYRPGPMDLIPEYIQRKKKKKKVEYLHPNLEKVLKPTYGLPIFQEQIMQISQVIAGFSASEADVLRKAIGKKIKSLLIAQKEKFIQGAIKNGTPKEIAEKIWEWIMPFARYGFCRAHATSYAIISYQTAYLKAHFPLEFMTAVLCSKEGDVEKIAFLIEECKRMKIDVLPPDINESEKDFTIATENKIRFGLKAIKNVGHNTVDAIVEERKRKGPFKSIGDFLARIEINHLNKKSFESLIKAGVFDRFEDRNVLLKNVESLLSWARQIQKQKLSGQKSLFGKTSFNHNPSLRPAEPTTKKQKLIWEKELLGLYISAHPLEDFKELFEKKVFPIAKIASDFFGKKVRIGGIISQIKRIVARNGKPMLFITVEDHTDKIEVIGFPSVVEKYTEMFQENKIVFISGKIDGRDGTPKIICEEIEEIIEKETLDKKNSPF